MYVDATFRVPKQFYQCLVIMVFDMSRGIYVPCAWVLMTGKTMECYWQVFNWLTSVVQDLNPSYFGVDFERTFWTNVVLHFPNVKLVGCNFHFKQAGKRNMKKHHIPGHEIGYAMRFGVYNLLTVIPPEHLESGVEFVLDIIEAHLEHIYKDDAPALKKSKSHWWGFFEKYFK